MFGAKLGASKRVVLELEVSKLVVPKLVAPKPAVGKHDVSTSCVPLDAVFWALRLFDLFVCCCCAEVPWQTHSLAKCMARSPKRLNGTTHSAH